MSYNFSWSYYEYSNTQGNNYFYTYKTFAEATVNAEKLDKTWPVLYWAGTGHFVYLYIGNSNTLDISTYSVSSSLLGGSQTYQGTNYNLLVENFGNTATLGMDIQEEVIDDITYYYVVLVNPTINADGTTAFITASEVTAFHAAYPTQGTKCFNYGLPTFYSKADAINYLNTGTGTPNIPAYEEDSEDAYDNVPNSEDSDASSGPYSETNDTISVPAVPNILPISSNMIRVYELSIQNLTDLAAVMWSDDFITNFKKLFNEPMDAVISLNMIETYGNVSESQADIFLGDYDTHVIANRITNNYVDDDFGTVTISNKTNSFMDYNPHTTINAYLPTVGMVSLDPDMVMGHTLQCKRRTDLLTGATVIYLINDLGVVYTYAGNGAFQLPMTGSNYNALISNIMHTVGSAVSGGISGGVVGAVSNAAAGTLGTITNSKTNVMIGGSISAGTYTMSVGYPYIIGKYPRICKPTNQQHYTGYPSLRRLKVSEFGDDCYLKVREIIFKSKTATKTEADEVEQLMKEGVYL